MLDWLQDLSLQMEGCVFADGYIAVLKIKMEICEVGRRVKTESFSSAISIWSLSRKLTIRATIKSMCPLLFLRIFFRKIFYKLLWKHMWQTLFLVKFHYFSIIFWAPLDEYGWSMKIILWGTSNWKWKLQVMFKY